MTGIDPPGIEVVFQQIQSSHSSEGYSMSPDALRRLSIVIGIFGSSLLLGNYRLADVRSEDRTGPPSVAVRNSPDATAKHDSEQTLSAFDRSLLSAGGGTATLRELFGEKLTVLVFLSTECPISNGYVPTLNQLAADFADQGVRLVGINSNDGISLRELATHRKEFAITFPVLKDAAAVVAGELKVTHCPEATVIDREGQVRYRGRIDDRYTKRGGAAGDTQRKDLQIAIAEVLADKPVSISETKVLGCPIHRRNVTASKSSEVTYSEHVAPVFQAQCENCHRPGGIGPFALQTFDQAVLWADDIREFTANRQMPPWLPADGAGDFHNRRALSADEISLIAKWVESGCPEGDRQKLPPPRQYSDDWVYGTPDLIVQPSQPFDVPASGKDLYQCFVLPTDFDTDQFVEAVEVRPGNSRVVHHVIVYLDTSDRSTQLDAKDPGLGYSTAAGFPGFLPAGGLGGWAPGNLPRRLPGGTAKVLPAKAKLVVQVHYHPSGKAEQDQTQVGLYFCRHPVKRVIRVLPIMPLGGPWSGMRLRAGDDNAEVKSSITLPRDSLALTITPHMHLLGKDMSVTATLPDGTVLPLIKLQRWDFNWQESYQYRELVSLPKGTQLDLVAHYDNSAGNPKNPNRPPKDVRWGENTVDEMCIAFLEIVPVEEARSPADLKAPTPLELLKEGVTARFNSRAQNRERSSKAPN